jgi:Sulfotransferase domain
MPGQLILSVGMPRAGSGWHYNLIHDLLTISGGKDARNVRHRYHLSPFLTEVNCNISTLKPNRLIPVLLPTIFGDTYAVKTHAGPTSISDRLIKLGRIHATYIYRDPRAALLSAYEYGQKAIVKGQVNAFSQLRTLDQAAGFMEQYVAIWEAWVARENVLKVKYEILLQDYEQESIRLGMFLGIDLSEPAAKAILEQYRPEQGNRAQRGTHFSQGQAERFRKIFTSEELDKYTQLFAKNLNRMGYDL